MRIITLDIETIPDPDLMQRYSKPIEVKYGNLKDPALRRAKEEATEAARVDGAALDPHVSRVLGWYVYGCEGEFPAVLEGGNLLAELSDAGEQHILGQLDRYLRLAKVEGIITFNGASFDIPFLVRRAAILTTRWSPQPWPTNRYEVIKGPRVCPHLDLRLLLAFTLPGNGPTEFRPGDLDYYCKLFLGRGKTDPDHELLWKKWAAGDREAVNTAGREDAQLTAELYHRLKGWYF